MISLIEPTWSLHLSQYLFVWMQSHVLLYTLIPLLADIFVFSYPIYLVSLYVYGMFTKNIAYKIDAIAIFFGTCLAALVNILIQFFVDKSRPDIVLGVVDLKTPSILHRFLPSASFPSDHAAIGMWIAFSSLVWWLKTKKKLYIWIAICLMIFSLIMSFARLTSAIHWLTDLIAGSLIGMIIPLCLTHPKVSLVLHKFGTRIGRRI